MRDRCYRREFSSTRDIAGTRTFRRGADHANGGLDRSWLPICTVAYPVISSRCARSNSWDTPQRLNDVIGLLRRSPSSFKPQAIGQRIADRMALPIITDVRTYAGIGGEFGRIDEVFIFVPTPTPK